MFDSCPARAENSPVWGYRSLVPQKPCLVFGCAHFTDERLYGARGVALEADYECIVLAFREHDSLGGIAEELLANTSARFTLIGLSLGGYVAFEIIRRDLQRLERLVLMDTTAAADHAARRAGQFADIAKVRDGWRSSKIVVTSQLLSRERSLTGC